MRISSREGDEGYKLFMECRDRGAHVQVFLDGQLKNVTWADTEAGEIGYVSRDIHGEPIRAAINGRTYIEYEKRFGRVEILIVEPDQIERGALH